MKTTLFVFVLLVGGIITANAQQSAVLDEYIRIGLSENLMLKQQELDIQKSIEAIRQAKALFFPTVQFNASYTVAAGGRKIDFPIGDLLNPVYGTLNQLTQSNNFPTLENQQVNFLPNNFQETKIKFTYPIYNTDLRYNREIKELLLLSKSAQKTAYEQELRFNIKQAYLQYLQATEAEKIWGNAMSVLQEVRRFNESLVKNNVATRDVVADADYQISKAEHEIFDLKTRQNTARAYFNFLINRDLQSDVTIDSSVLQQPIPTYELNQMIQNAQANRREFAALEAGKQAAGTAVQLQEANKKIPDFYLGGETGFQGFGYNFGQNQAYVLAQVGLTYDIYQGGARNSKVQEAKLDAEKINTQINDTRQQIALQVTDRWNQLESAKNAHSTSRQAQKSAEESFRIINNKYRAGQALLLELMDAQNRVTTARLQTLLAWLDVLQRQQALLQAAGME